MRYRIFILCLFAIFLLLPHDAAGFVYSPGPQVQDWDRILDKYESLCDECIDLMLRVEAGEKVSRTAVSGLLSSFTELRKILRDGSGAMSAAQRKRFERIKERYASAVGETDGGDETKEEPRDSAAVRAVDAAAAGHGREVPGSRNRTAGTGRAEDAKPAKAEPVVEKKRAPFGYAVPQMNTAFGGYAWTEASASIIPLPVSSPPTDHAVSAGRRFSFSVGAVFSAVPDFSYGAVASMVSEKYSFGGYIKFRGDFNPSAYDYECRSDGAFSGGTVWANGDASVSKMQLSLGARKNFRPWLGMYAGAGYGRYLTFWDDVEGNRAKVTDYSVSGMSFECGLLLDFGPVEFMAGVSTIMFRYSDVELGVGVRF